MALSQLRTFPRLETNCPGDGSDEVLAACAIETVRYRELGRRISSFCGIGLSLEGFADMGNLVNGLPTGLLGWCAK
jgi:hypothetical protein